VAVSDSYLAFVLEQLDGVPRVSSRRMFGGVGLYSDDRFFAVIDNDTLFFKVDDSTRTRYTKRRMPPFHPMPDKPPMTGYHQVPLSILEDRDALAEWARESVGVARRVSERPRAAARRSKSRRT
jgi:DNA transformation protein and related proteins